ncbi:unnamed protein product [Diatraea saccharalis]|uniref:Uncharacterized protein n=1 Tax=Diatraea saccharalis TaxID=40085 RepID=A0A9N9RGF0_9NEOP|nr:unnamed protein product [Diatraea saccharalis]
MSIHILILDYSGYFCGGDNSTRGVVSLPGSPRGINTSVPVVGSAESLVTRVLAEQGLGAYCDADFVRNTSREMQEALEMTQEQMDRAAHQLMVQEKNLKLQNQQPQVDDIWAVTGRHFSSTIPPFSPTSDDAATTLQTVIAPTPHADAPRDSQNGGKERTQNGAPKTAKRHSHHRRKRKRKPVLV